MRPNRLLRRATHVCIAVLLCASFSTTVIASEGPGAPQPDVNLIGPTPDPDDVRDFGLKQQNEPACAIRPGNSQCIICFYNDYRTVDRPGHEDAWTGMSESCDGGLTFRSRVTPGHPLHPAPINTNFAADPRVVSLPGMSIHAFIGGFRTPDRSVLGIQHWLENNQDDLNYNEPALNTIIAAEGPAGEFVDKPELLAVLDDGPIRVRRGDDDDDCDDDDDDDHPCFVESPPVTLSFDMEDSGLGTITRTFPAGTLYAAYAVFMGNDASELFVRTSRDWGKTWTTAPIKLSIGQQRVSGVTMTTLGSKVVAMWRQAEPTQDALYYAYTTNRGESWTSPQLLTSLCSFDQPSATTASPPQATFRTNDFPWLANDGKNIYAFYSERVGNCDTGTPKVFFQYSSNASTWSGPQPIDSSPQAAPGSQFMPAAFGANGKIQVAWYDTRREDIPLDPTLPFVLDYIDGTLGVRVNRKVDVYTARITSNASGGNVQVSESAQVNSYQTAGSASDSSGALFEIEASFANALMYKTGLLSFLGDYIAVAAPEFRLNGNGEWESNYSPAPPPASNSVDFFVAYADHRDVRGDVLLGDGASQKPYTPPSNTAPAVRNATPDPDDKPETRYASTRTDSEPEDGARAEGIEDTLTDPAVAVCTPGNDSDRTRDANIYGSVIRDLLRLSAPAPTRPLSGILRAIPFTASNITDSEAQYRLYISNQPGPADLNRASFRQKPDRPPFASDDPPVVVEDVSIRAQSSVARTVFLVSPDIGASVDIKIYDGVCAANADASGPLQFASVCEELGTLRLGGGGTEGDLRQPDYLSTQCTGDPQDCDVFVTELHNPLLQNPLLQNPLLQNPLLQNPLLQNPLLQNPLLQNPLLQNVGFQNPLLQNPLLQNPLLQNPLLQNPLLQNPLLQNPLLQNSAIESGVTFTDITAVVQNDGNVITAYNVDATAVNFESTAGGAPVSQLIVWKQYAYASSRDCETVPEVRNQVIATINQPDNTLSEATIDEPFAGEASLILAPGELGFVTYRFFGTEAELANARVQRLTLSAQAANCDEFDDIFGPPPGTFDNFYSCEGDLGDNRELITIEVDSTPPVFNGLVDGQVLPIPAIEANREGGACVDPLAPPLAISATDDTSSVSIQCVNAVGQPICLAAETGLSIPVSNIGPVAPVPSAGSPISCTATDSFNNSTTINLLVDVRDDLPPFFTSVAMNPTTVIADALTGTADVNLEGGFAGEDVNGVDPSPVISCETTDGRRSGPIPAGMYDVDCRITDRSGNFEQFPYMLNVQDVTAPVITLVDPSPVVFVEAGGIYNEQGASADDAVDGAVGVTISGTVNTGVPGDYPIEYTAVDAAGNTATADRIVRVQDTTPPTLPVLVDFSVDADPTGSAVIAYSLPTAGDNAAASPLVSCVPPAGTILPVGTTIVTCTASDASGNTAQATFEVTVNDVTPPVVTLAGDPTITLEAKLDTYVEPGASAEDSVDGSVPVTISGSVNEDVPGSYVLTYTATDGAGNSASNTRTVIVEDTTAPVITLNGVDPLTLEAGVDNYIEAGATASDSVDGPVSVTPSGVVDTAIPGTYTVTYEATDNAGNSATTTRTVIVVDTTPPVVTLIGPTNLTLEAGVDMYTEQNATADDAADGSLQVTITGTVDVSTPGVYTLVYTATDAANLSGSAERTVTVVDTLAPVVALNGAPSLTVEAATGYVDQGATAVDAADGAVGVVASGAVNVNQLGIYTITYTATDNAGNVGAAVRSVEVVDTTAPVVSLNGSPALTIEAVAEAYVEQGAAAEDTLEGSVNVSITSNVNSDVPGTYTVTYSASDSSNNTGTAIRTVTVVDTTAPAISVPADPFLVTIEGPGGAVGDFGQSVTTSDLVDPSPSLACTPQSGSLFPPGESNVTCTSTDASGNSASASFTVKVGYAGGTGITPSKLTAKRGSTVPLTWAWLTASGSNADSSGDMQMLRIIKCGTNNVILERAGDPGTSGFRYNSDNSWKFNWQTVDDRGRKLPKGEYCASATSMLTGDMQESPPIKLQ